MNKLFVGIDIAADTAAVHWQLESGQHGGASTIVQTDAEYHRLHQQLTAFAHPQDTYVVMEATGNYWLKLALFLHQADYLVSVINPQQARHFARLHLQRTKTDAIDAQLLCAFAQQVRPPRWSPAPAIAHQLRHVLERRDDLLKMATQERNRLHALDHDPLAPPAIRAQLKRHIATLKRQAQALLAQIEDLLAQNSDWHQAARHLLSIPGIGAVTAAWLLVTTHAFTRCDTPQQLAAYAGLVPHHRQSGRSLRGRSSIGGGHPKLRQALYMAAGACIRYNPPLKAFYDNKVAQGKIKQVARVAVARKLVHYAWACVVKGRDFDPNFAQHADVA